jgi:hypothetical protein
MVERAPALGPLPVEAATALLQGLNFGVAKGALDPNPQNDAGAALFAAGHAGAEARTLCQVTVCGRRAPAFRCAVLSQEPWGVQGDHQASPQPTQPSPPNRLPTRQNSQVRLEGNPQNRLQFRVTVAAPDAALAAAVKDTMAGLIRGAALPAA